MKVGDLINYRGKPHIVVSIRPSMPVARPNHEQVVLKNTVTLKTRTTPMKWIKGETS
jgi:hypothetical protein